MLAKRTSSMDRLDLAVDMKSLDLGFVSGSSDGIPTRYAPRTETIQRASNVWPAPISADRAPGEVFGEAARNSFGIGTTTNGRGFGRLGEVSGFRSSFGSGFGASAFGGSLRWNSTNQSPSTIAHSTTSEVGKERKLMSPESDSLDMQSQHRGFFDSSPRLSSGRRSSSKRSKTSRRKSGRRGGSDRPGHCFNCGEHGHISKMCPRKLIVSSTDEIRMTGNEIGAGDTHPSDHFRWDNATDRSMSTRNSLLKTTDRNLCIDDDKLETQKARLSYYGCIINNDNEPPKCASPDVDKFSEQLDNALKLSPSVTEEAMSAYEVPSWLQEKRITNGRGGAFPTAAKAPDQSNTQERQMVKAADGKEEVDPSSTMTIETRRSVKRDGEPYFEEWTIFSFPRVLPANVHVITAQFVSGSSQKTG